MIIADPILPAEVLKPGQPATKSPQTLFQEDWWLRAAGGDAVHRVAVNWGGSTVASLSFMVKRRFPDVRFLVVPPYTRTLGPVLDLPASGPTQRAMNLCRVAAELMALLPKHDYFYSLLDPDDESALGFSLAGCSVMQQYTFRAAAGGDPAQLLLGVEATTRRLIRAGSRQLVVQHHFDLNRFIALAGRDVLTERSEHDFAAMGRLFEACATRGQTTILTAVDQFGADVASVVLVWGHGTLYYWLPHRDRARAGGNANAFLLWTALEFALDRGLAFDTDGFRSVGTARFMASFGLPQRVRPLIVHRTLRGTLADAVRGGMRNSAVKDLKPDPLSFLSAGNVRRSARFKAMLRR